MRITAVEVTPLDLQLQTALTVAYGSYPVLNYALVQVVTDEGRVGLGEASPDPVVTGETQESVLAALRGAAPLWVGRDPLELEALLREAEKSMPHTPAALAALDMALYDLMGQKLGVPVYQLLGGRSRPGIALYPVIPLDEAHVMAEMSARFVGMGASVLKVKLGGDARLDLQRIQAICAAVGRGVRLRLDVNQGWENAETAIAVIRALQAYPIEWVEQPLAAADLTGMAAVTAAVDVPVMADESCHSAADVIQIARLRSASMINIKLMKCGGMLRAAKMLAAAEAAGLTCILGSMGESTIGSAAGLHFVTANPTIAACEAIGPLFITNDPASGFGVDPATLWASPSDQPGLGVKLR